jgi:hypothetical protein
MEEAQAGLVFLEEKRADVKQDILTRCETLHAAMETFRDKALR